MNFNDELTIHITYSPGSLLLNSLAHKHCVKHCFLLLDEYDRNKPDDFDPDGNRILWDEEREEERMRQLEIR